MTKNVLLQSQLSNVDNVVDHCRYAHRQVVLACLLCSHIMASCTKREGLFLPVRRSVQLQGSSSSALCCLVIRRLVLGR